MNATAQIHLEHWRPDPDRPGYLKFAGTPTYREVFEQLTAALRADGLIDEYFSPALPFGERAMHESVPRGVQWIAAWAATGDSEGHYIHVELAFPDNSRIPLTIGKTFLGWDHAWAIAKRAAELLGA